MPEMKRTFTKGKMNKDLDERLVPNGEYRDAMNIQVSTSEGSDVGTIQNVLGNTPGCETNLAPDNSYTVGSVSDEKNDTLYWLVSGQQSPEPQMKDMILRRTPNFVGGYICEPVFVDNYAFQVPNDGTGSVSTVSIVNLSLGQLVQEGWTVTGVADDGSLSNTVTVIDVITEQQVGFSWVFTTSNTPTYSDFCVGTSAFCNGNAIKVEHGCIFPCSGDHNTIGYNYVYLAGFMGSPGDLIGQYIDLDPYGSGANITPGPNLSPTPGYQIIAAANYGWTNQNLISSNYIKLTLDASITPAAGGVYDILQPIPPNPPWAPAFGPSSIENTTGNAISDLGSAVGNIPAIITQGTPVYNTVPDNGFIYPAEDVSNWTLNDPIVLNPGQLNEFNGCIGAIDTAQNYIQVVDCNDPTIVAEPQIINPALQTYEQSGMYQTDATIVFNFGSQQLNLSSNTYSSLTFEGPRVLNFDHGDLILGINIIDEFLIWTDNKTEPKKISIPRSVAGTNPNGNVHTDLMLPDSSGNIVVNKGPIKEEHITVIRKAPHRPPTIEMSTERRGGNPIGEGYKVLNIGTPQNTFSAVTEILYVDIADVNGIACDFVVGDVLGLNDGNNIVNGDIFHDGYQIRLKILEVNTGPYTNVTPGGPYGVSGNPVGPSLAGVTSYLVEVVSFDQNIGASTTYEWFVELEDVEEFLFEQKLPRFAYRYKYVDNEYSTYGPFSNVAFAPGDFEYQPVKAYNEGITNKLRQLTIKDFIPSDIPKDVVQVDILYKNESSPIVYLMDSIRENDAPLLNNSWYEQGSSGGIGAATGSYKVTTENIYAALPANQSIRTWDNVPITALAQDVSGNRIIYGNYKQGYSMEEIANSGAGELIPDITVALSQRKLDFETEKGKKSIKSLRNYDVGVVWGDKYGRETPVITPSSGSLVVPKSEASFSNYIQASLSKSPFWADYYRFYIKETSNQYYNLPVDRIYDAEDGNVWVSFPSVDRNKIDEDTYIILKKGSDTDTLVPEKARYKVVAIENEAPEYIKTSYEVLARTNTDSTTHVSSCLLFGGRLNLAANNNAGSDGLGNGCPIYPNAYDHITPPKIGRKSFTIDYKHWIEPYSTSISTKAMGLPDLKKIFDDVNADNTSDEFYVSFTRETSVVGGTTTIIAGSKYRVLEVLIHQGTADPSTGNLGTTTITTDDGSTSNSDVYEIKLSTPILTTDEFVTDGYDPVTGQLINDNIHIHFWKKTIRNKPEFDGRFFVKIFSDGNDRKNLKNAPAAVKNWAINAATSLYKIDDSANLSDTADGSFNYNTGASSLTRSENDWAQLLKFSGNNASDRWFIDNASFASIQPNTNVDYNNAGISFVDSFGTTHTSIDNSSNVNFNMNCSSCFFGGSYTYYQGGVLPAVMVANGQSFVNFGTGLSTGIVGMKGAHVVNNQKKLDLSYSKFGNPSGQPQISQNGRTTFSSLNWTIGSDPLTGGGVNSATDQEAKITEGLQVNSRFRLYGSDIIYRVISTLKFRLFNFQGRSTAVPKKFHVELPFVPGTYWNSQYMNQQKRMARENNRRFTYRIIYDIDTVNTDSTLFTPDPGLNPLLTPDDITANPQFAAITNNKHITGVTETPGQIEFLTEYSVEGENKISNNPAIFETEPKEDADLDLYYEASSSFPTHPLTNLNKQIYIPIGSTLEISSELANAPANIPIGIFVSSWDVVLPPSPPNPQIVTINLSTPLDPATQYFPLSQQEVIKFLRDDETYVTAAIFGPVAGTVIIGGIPTTMVVGLQIIPKLDVGLGWHNCWSFGNGVESNRIGDTYNKPFLGNGVAVSSIIEDNFKQEHKKYSLTYSGLYNSNSGINNLNQFIAGEKITKDLNPIYGSIQRLKAGWGQGGDLIALCEDRILKILANKDALFNADGNTNVTATNRVLGQAIPYSGEYGISTNPESFASEAYRAYFTDKVRGTVMRLSMDGLTPISDAGMKDWFRDNLKLGGKLVGSYDDKKDEYNITINSSTDNLAPDSPNFTPITVSFREDVKGWVSFKSFTTNNGISCANDYFTFKGGELWLHHHDAPNNRNTFYNIFKKSTFDVLLNDAPDVVKSFYTLNYEGSGSKVTIDYTDDQYHNLTAKFGWYVDTIFTNKESGDVYEFIEKEGKWFNYIRGKDVSYSLDDSIIVDPDGDSSWDQDSFAIQGLGAVGGVSSPPQVLGCTNPLATNYDPTATTDDGSCILPAPIPGCTYATADNYDATATNDDGSCIWSGCTDVTAENYGWNGTSWPAEAQTYMGVGMVDDGNCTYCAYGCMDPLAFNYDATATCDGQNCIPTVEGCVGQNVVPLTSAGITNYDPNANTDNGSCIWEFCGEPADSAYDAAADAESTGYIVANGGSINNVVGCVDGGCTDPTAFNYNPAALWDDGSCIPTISGCMDPTANNYNDYDADGVGNPLTGDPFIDVNTDDGTCDYLNECYICGDHSQTGLPGYIEYSPIAWPTPGVCPGPALTFAEAETAFGIGFSVDDCCILGCTDPQAISGNNLGTATCDDGSCGYAPANVPGCPAGTGANNADCNPSMSPGATSPCNDGVTTDDGSCNYDNYCVYCDAATGYVVEQNYLGLQGLNTPSDQLLGGICNPNVNAFDGNEYTVDPNNATNAQQFVALGNWEGISAGDGCIRGCTDPLAANYDASATFDDGTCSAAIQGCTDPAAWDYDVTANVSIPCSFCTSDSADSNNWCTGPSTNNGVWDATDAGNYEYMGQGNCLVQHNGEWWQYDSNYGSGITSAPGVDDGSGSLWIRCNSIEDTCTGSQVTSGSGSWVNVFSAQYVQYDVVEWNGEYYEFAATVNNGNLYEPGNPSNWYDANSPWMYCVNSDDY